MGAYMSLIHITQIDCLDRNTCSICPRLANKSQYLYYLLIYCESSDSGLEHLSALSLASIVHASKARRYA